MVIAGIVAGGVGARMGQNIRPKQFIELKGKPIIIHTIEKFMVSPDIDYMYHTGRGKPEWDHQEHCRGREGKVSCGGRCHIGDP